MQQKQNKYTNEHWVSPDAETCSLNNWSDCSLVLWGIPHLLLKADAERTRVFLFVFFIGEVRSNSCMWSLTHTLPPPHAPASPAPWMPTQHVEERVTHAHVDWRKIRRQAMDGNKEETGDSHRQTLMLWVIHKVFVEDFFFLHFSSKQMNRNIALQFFLNHPPSTTPKNSLWRRWRNKHTQFAQAFTDRHFSEHTCPLTPNIPHISPLVPLIAWLNSSSPFEKGFNLTIKAAFHTLKTKQPYIYFSDSSSCFNWDLQVVAAGAGRFPLAPCCHTAGWRTSTFKELQSSPCPRWFGTKNKKG